LFGITGVVAKAAVKISNVSVDREIFNPTKGEQMVISYTQRKSIYIVP